MNRKVLFLVFVGFVAGLFSISFTHCKNDSVYNPKDTVEYTLRSDTLSELIGRAEGYAMYDYIENVQQHDTVFNRKEFLKGLKYSLSHRYDMAYISGLQLGIDMSMELNNMIDSGLDINRKDLVKEIKENMKPDEESVFEKRQEYIFEFQNIYNQVMKDHYKLSKAGTDSLQHAYAKAIGYFIAGDIASYNKEENGSYDKDMFLKSFEHFMSKKHPDSYMHGAYVGAQTVQKIIRTEMNLGVNIRRETVLKEMLQILKANEYDATAAGEANTELDAMLNKLNNEKYEAEEVELANSDEAIQNIKTSEAEIAKLKSENPNIATTESGLTYLITKPGEGENITENDQLRISYKGMHLDGNVLDQGEDVPMTVNGVIPGFKEGLLLLKKGSKATLWIPGNLAYRGHGQPYGGIGPMETLVFEIEVNDVITPDTSR